MSSFSIVLSHTRHTPTIFLPQGDIEVRLRKGPASHPIVFTHFLPRTHTPHTVEFLTRVQSRKLRKKYRHIHAHSRTVRDKVLLPSREHCSTERKKPGRRPHHAADRVLQVCVFVCADDGALRVCGLAARSYRKIANAAPKPKWFRSLPLYPHTPYYTFYPSSCEYPYFRTSLFSTH